MPERANFVLLLCAFLLLCSILLLAVLHWQWLSWQILQWQGQLHRQMAVLLRAALSPSPETKLLLLGLCFLYGVLRCFELFFTGLDMALKYFLTIECSHIY